MTLDIARIGLKTTTNKQTKQSPTRNILNCPTTIKRYPYYKHTHTHLHLGFSFPPYDRIIRAIGMWFVIIATSSGVRSSAFRLQTHKRRGKTQSQQVLNHHSHFNVSRHWRNYQSSMAWAVYGRHR